MCGQHPKNTTLLVDVASALFYFIFIILFVILIDCVLPENVEVKDRLLNGGVLDEDDKYV